MSLYSKYLIVVACIGLVGFPIFMLDTNDLSWINNRELYWGMIALVAMIAAVLVENRAKKIQNKIKEQNNSVKN